MTVLMRWVDDSPQCDAYISTDKKNQVNLHPPPLHHYVSLWNLLLQLCTHAYKWTVKCLLQLKVFNIFPSFPIPALTQSVSQSVSLTIFKSNHPIDDSPTSKPKNAHRDLVLVIIINLTPSNSSIRILHSHNDKHKFPFQLKLKQFVFSKHSWGGPGRKKGPVVKDNNSSIYSHSFFYIRFQ